ncbi:MAG: apolipoprotein N-acyltransferase [Elusimicrobiaceae bacterium]|nr:apolipoprotein N-acyltransferase [Elusimicrobiaceae bacterium]
MSFFRGALCTEKQPLASTSPARLFFLRVVRVCGWGIWLLLCAAATVCLFKFSYPSSSFYLLAWLALAPFVMGLLFLRTFWRSVWYSWLTGTAVYAALYYWVFVTCHDGGGLGVGLSVAAWLGLSALMAVQFAIFGGSCYYLKNLQGFFPLVAACGWAALDWGHEIIATYLLGFPWFSSAYSQWNFPSVLQIASWGGAVSLSFAIAFVGISVGYGLLIPHLRRGVGHFICAAAVFLGIFYYGNSYLKHPQKPSLLRLSAAVMQPNIDQYKKWDLAFEAEIKDTLDLLAKQVADKQPMLLVWPESVTPGSVQEEPYRAWLEEIAQQTGAWQILGSNREDGARQYVSAFVISPQGNAAGVYDKTHLVPFGEYIPLEKQVRSVFKNIAVLGELGSFSAGAWEQELLHLDQIALGSTICYESVFSHLWKEQARAGARFFVNLTNDAWFFDTAAPHQHLAAAVLRAVESRRTVLRAANTGISAVIAPTGEILARAELNTRAVLLTDVPLPLGTELSFYNQWPNWFAWLCVVVYLTTLLSALIFSYE